MDMKAIFLSYAFPPQQAPRAVQIARLAQYSSLPIRVLCAGKPGTGAALRAGVEVLRFGDNSPRWWRLAKHVICLPDSERPWADRVARTVLSERLIGPDDVLITFGQPMSDHVAGLAIKRRIGMPWIAHFSDPWSDNPYGTRNPVSRFRLRSMERDVFAAADRLVFTSDETVELVMRKYSAAWRAKASVLPHAYDPDFNNARTRREGGGTLVLRHLGNFYGQRNPLKLVDALRLLHAKQPGILTNVRIELIGRWVGHENWSPAGSGLPEGLVSVHSRIVYEDSLRQMLDADALLIIDAPFEQNVFFPSKLVDYLWARRPMLALTPPGTSAKIVAAAGGIVASPETTETIADGLAELIGRLRAGTIHAPAENVVARYDARTVATAFDCIVHELAGSGKAPAGSCAG